MHSSCECIALNKDAIRARANRIWKKKSLFPPCSVKSLLRMSGFSIAKGKMKCQGTDPRWCTIYSATIQTGHSNKAVLTDRDTAKTHFSEVFYAIVKQSDTNRMEDQHGGPLVMSARATSSCLWVRHCSRPSVATFYTLKLCLLFREPALHENGFKLFFFFLVVFMCKNS